MSSIPSSSSINTTQSRVRRRNRIIASCLECRRRKLKCDRTAPCANCSRNARDCRYLATSLDANAKSRLEELKEQIGTLEKSLPRDLAAFTAGPVDGVGFAADENDELDEGSDELDNEHVVTLKIPPVLDQVYEDDADDEVTDLGIRLGKMRASERIGSFVVAGDMFKVTSDRPPSDKAGIAFVGARQPSIEDQEHARLNPDLQYLGPGTDYLAPASDLFFSNVSYHNVLSSFLPAQRSSDQLLSQYWHAVHPVMTIVHRPSFETRYAKFWADIHKQVQPRASSQALIFAALFNAAVTLSDEVAINMTGSSKSSLVEMLKTGAELSLSKANFIRTTKLETMQAFTHYLVPLCRAEVSRAHSALTGTAIRLAMCMGLHRDPSHYGFSTVETHVRRLVWYNLCVLDVRTCEATGPRPQIRKEDFDTKLPMDVNESDLHSATSNTRQGFTDMTVSRVKFECIEAHRSLWTDMARMEAKQIKLSAVINKIQRFRTSMEERYLPLLRGRDPRQLLALHIYRILSNRLLIFLTHRYVVPDTGHVPDRLRTICIDACLTVNEHSVSLDTRAELNPWSWYRGVMQQYTSSLILLLEVHRDPHSLNAARIWKILDYVFELSPDSIADEKFAIVFGAFRARMQALQSLRKLKSSNHARDESGLLFETTDARRDVHAHTSEETSAAGTGTAQTGQPDMDRVMEPQEFAFPPMRPSISEFMAAPFSDQSNDQTDASTPSVAATLDEIDWSVFEMSDKGYDPYLDLDNMMPSSENIFDAGLADIDLGGLRTDFPPPMNHRT